MACYVVGRFDSPTRIFLAENFVAAENYIRDAQNSERIRSPVGTTLGDLVKVYGSEVNPVYRKRYASDPAYHPKDRRDPLACVFFKRQGHHVA